ncbi:MAG: winged helix-turn-helix domain-containing protein [Rickettsiaceae bacterium]|nr:winged helix-turn-helix domain-containing protein [Rickettsiaceae bacterium]
MTDKLPPKVFVIEKDDLLRTSLSNAIERYWFNVLRAADVESAIRLIKVNKPNIIILSTKQLGEDPVETIKIIRGFDGCSEMPFVLMIDETEAADTFKPVDDGNLAIVYRPYTPNEVMTSIKTLLRKSKPIFQDKVIRYKDLSMDLATFKVYRANQHIHLGPTEFKILQLLVQSPKTIFSRQQIVDYVWGLNQPVESRTVDVHVNRLRSLIKVNADEIPFIKTVRSSGYCLNLPGELD